MDENALHQPAGATDKYGNKIGGQFAEKEGTEAPTSATSFSSKVNKDMWDSILFENNMLSGEDYEEVEKNLISDYDENKADSIDKSEKKDFPIKANAVFQMYGTIFDLDKGRLGKASPKELEKLVSALKGKMKADTFDQSSISKLEEQFQSASFNVWKGHAYVSIKDFPKFADSLDSKIQWFKENGYSHKAAVLEKLPALYDEWKEKTTDYGNSLNAGKIISKYQSPYSLYSQSRKDGAIWCNSFSEAQKTFTPLALKQNAKMTKKEKETIYDYTHFGSRTINMPLNGLKTYSNYATGDPELYLSKILDRVHALTSAFDKCQTDGDIWLQRGVDDNMDFGGLSVEDLASHPEDYIGKCFVNNSFMSCGSAKGTGFDDKPVMLNVYVPRGAHAHYVNYSYTDEYGMHNMSYYMENGENETIIQRGYSYKITKIVKKDGTCYVDMDLILGSDAKKLTDEQMIRKYKKGLGSQLINDVKGK